MSEINDGGPAFPIPGAYKLEARNGMSLRDYMAIHAPPPFAADESHVNIRNWHPQLPPFPTVEQGQRTPEELSAYYLAAAEWGRNADAVARYAWADSMLRAREK